MNNSRKFRIYNTDELLSTWGLGWYKKVWEATGHDNRTITSNMWEILGKEGYMTEETYQWLCKDKMVYTEKLVFNNDPLDRDGNYIIGYLPISIFEIDLSDRDVTQFIRESNPGIDSFLTNLLSDD